MEKITTGLKICPKCRHLMVIKEGKMTCPKCDREKLEEELKTATKKVGRAEVVDFPSDTPIEEIDQKCKEWTKDGVGSWVLLCIA